VLADKAYDADWIRELNWKQGAVDVIPPKANRKMPAEFDAEIYRERNKIERVFGRLKASFRRIEPRYEKTSRNFLSMIKLASVRLWVAFYVSAARTITFQLPEVVVIRVLFRRMLAAIHRLSAPPVPT
jgi:transposase